MTVLSLKPNFIPEPWLSIEQQGPNHSVDNQKLTPREGFLLSRKSCTSYPGLLILLFLKAKCRSKCRVNLADKVNFEGIYASPFRFLASKLL